MSRSSWIRVVLIGALLGWPAPIVEPLRPPSLEASLLRRLALTEYRPSFHDRRLSAPNRAHGLHLFWNPSGVEVRDRSEGALLLSLSTLAVGRALAMRPLESRAFELAASGRVERRWDDVVEWWQNSERGPEQSWTIEAPPPGVGPLVITVRVGAAKVAGEGRGLELTADTGRTLEYGHLAAFDASGRKLGVRMGPDADGLRIEVDDDGAAFPIVVDPSLSAPAWTALGPTVGSELGFSVASAGDVNGDGYGDVVVGAPGFDNVQASGTAFVFFGSANGLAVNPSWTAPVSSLGGRFGASVAGAGDVNRDGFDDVLIGAPLYDNGQADEGRAQLFLGPNLLRSWSYESNAQLALLGGSVAGAGDVNGDGFDDVIVGGYGATGNAGRAWLFLGGAALSSTPSWLVTGSAPNEFFGASVASAGDVNRDGLADVIIGAPGFATSLAELGEGRVSVFLGTSQGTTGLQPTAIWAQEGNLVDAALGGSVAGAGDVNGDGFSDVVVGSSGYSNGHANEGRVVVFAGDAQGVQSGSFWSHEANEVGAQLGGSVGSAGDLNGDGYSDIVVGAPSWDAPLVDEGKAVVFLGGPTALRLAEALPQTGQAFAGFGASVAGAGDVNGDGLSELLVGAPYFVAMLSNQGQAFAFSGNASGPGQAALTFSGSQASSLFGHSVTGAGDVNGDGLSDLLVGAGQEGSGALNWAGSAWLFLDGGGPGQRSSVGIRDAFFGYSVARAGNVNGDAFGDVVVGAFGVDGGGLAMVFNGQASGLAFASPRALRVNQQGADFGLSVAPAGDVNGDGFSDVIVGAPTYDDGESDEGAAFIFLGGGAAGSPPTVLQNNVAQASFGSSVAVAGDVNGDGFSDVIVGARGHPDGGAAFLYFGGANGMSAPWVATAPQTGSSFGASVAGAGDVNGDGVSDVLVGAPDTSSLGTLNHGLVFVYLGTKGGLPQPSTTLSSIAGSARFGLSVARAGDVNGDGYDDVIVGAPEMPSPDGGPRRGRAFIYAGSANGLSTPELWSASGDEFNGRFGQSVAGAGDVNGDGFDDVVVGVPGARVDLISEVGVARLFLGGDGAPGVPRGLRQSRGGPGVRFTGFVQLEALAIRSWAPSASRVVLEFEVKPLGAPFDGGDTRTTAVPVAPFARGSVFPVLQPGRYHWRVRSRVQGGAFDRWVRYGGNDESEADFVVLGTVPPLDGGVGDSGVSFDSGVMDAGAFDAGAPDSGTQLDGGTDAGSEDAGVVQDAGSLDAGSMDGGTPDAGSPDGGSPDGGATDAGLMDGGLSGDGGAPIDAGPKLPLIFVPVCGCSIPDGGAGLLLVPLVAALMRRRRKRQTLGGR